MLICAACLLLDMDLPGTSQLYNLKSVKVSGPQKFTFLPILVYIHYSTLSKASYNVTKKCSLFPSLWFNPAFLMRMVLISILPAMKSDTNSQQVGHLGIVFCTTPV